ncbi:hypothetical protein ACQEVB_08145 [Pseudonocardia sp. CA-107938]|uniref:hypothetical protein n=1 Tax=Pseudonocardia sp. CA-107938 TaxID=3240021 RepID=UPI003D910309
MKLSLTDPLRRTTVVAFVLSALGIPVQILGGWNYPPIPPGMIITLVGGLVAVLAYRWAPAVSLLAGAFILFGFFASGDVSHLAGTENVLVTIGKWLQFGTIVIGVVAAVASLVRPPVRAVSA